MNKKGFIASVPMYLWAIIIYVMAIIVFILLFNIKTAPRVTEINSQSVNLIAGNTLSSYLKTPITIDNEAIDISDLIRLYKQDKNKYGPILEKESSSILKSLNSCVFLCIDSHSPVYSFNDCSKLTKLCAGASQRIPNYNGQDIDVTLNPAKLKEVEGSD